MQAKNKPAFDLEAFLSSVDGGRTISKYAENEFVFRQGDPASAVFRILSGNCKVTVVSEQGKEAVVALHSKEDFFGEGCLTGQPVRLATVTAITDCDIMRLEKAAMLRVLHEQPKFSELFISHLLARNARIESDLVDQLFNSSEKRLASPRRSMAERVSSRSRLHHNKEARAMSGDPRECRLQAAECLQFAKSASSPQARETFTDFASTWLKLAAEFESDNTLLQTWGEIPTQSSRAA